MATIDAIRPESLNGKYGVFVQGCTCNSGNKCNYSESARLRLLWLGNPLLGAWTVISEER